MVTSTSVSEAAERLIEFNSVLGKLSGDRLLLCDIPNLDRALEWGLAIEKIISNSSMEQVEQFGEILRKRDFKFDISQFRSNRRIVLQTVLGNSCLGHHASQCAILRFIYTAYKSCDGLTLDDFCTDISAVVARRSRAGVLTQVLASISALNKPNWKEVKLACNGNGKECDALAHRNALNAYDLKPRSVQLHGLASILVDRMLVSHREGKKAKCKAFASDVLRMETVDPSQPLEILILILREPIVRYFYKSSGESTMSKQPFTEGDYALPPFWDVLETLLGVAEQRRWVRVIRTLGNLS